MEDVLDIYERPYDALHPVVCMDEKPYQLLGEAREPLPMRPGSNRKVDSEYVRNGTCSIFAFTQPLKGVRQVHVREHRTATDWAEIELNVMTRQCLSRRIADIETLKSELSAWESDRNTADSKIVWQFQTKDARVKLASLYPKIVEC